MVHLRALTPVRPRAVMLVHLSLQSFVPTRQNQGNYKLPRQKGSIFWCSVFFMVQLLYLYVITGKTITLTRQTFVSKVMSLLFNMLCRFVIAFLPRSKGLFISWLQSLSTVILDSKKVKPVTVCNASPSIYHEVMGLDTMILVV